MADARIHPEDELLMSAEHWAPSEAERWARWLESIDTERRTDVLLPLQAVLSGLVAFRDDENQPLSIPSRELRPQLRAVREAYAWALEQVGRLHDCVSWERHLTPAGAHAHDPSSALAELGTALVESLRLSDRLLGLPAIDGGVFHASCDVFLRELERNAFFRPPEPLEFANTRELVRRKSIAPETKSWSSEAARLTSWISLLALIRSHRYLGIADRQISEERGLDRAHIIVAAVRRELRMLTRFLMEQGIEAFVDELGAHRCSADEVDELRELVEALAMGLHAKAHAALDDPLPEPGSMTSIALPAERMRSGIRELRATVKDAAKELRELGRPEAPVRANRTSERLQRNLHQDIWGFRFILRGFIAKASVVPLGAGDWVDGSSDRFADEFVLHFRLFAPRLSRATDYPRRGPMIDAVTALAGRDEIPAPALAAAVRECTAFLAHLDGALEAMPHSMLAPFDKERAAAELRGYLAAARERKQAI